MTFERDPTIEMVMSDMVMPGGMSGLDLARTLRELRPELQFLLATGHSQDALQVIKEGFTLVEKSYHRHVLTAAIHRAAEHASHGRSQTQPINPRPRPAAS